MHEAPSQAITIRPAQPNDTDAITRIYLQSAEHHAGLDPLRYSIPSFAEISLRYREGRQHPEHGTSLVAELNGEVVGFIDVKLDRSQDSMHKDMLYCHTIEIAVSNAHQSRGIGAQLLRAAEDWGRAQGAELASLEYNAANHRAAEFYQKRMGYKIASITAIKLL